MFTGKPDNGVWCGAAALLVAVCSPAPSASAQTGAQQSSPTPGPSGEEYRRRLDELERANGELRARNQELERRLRGAEPAKESAPAEPVDIRQADPEAERNRFLGLGVKRDYLRQERFRIADQIESFIPPLYEPVRPFHAYTLPPGAVRIGMSSNLAFNNSDFGRDDRYAKLFEHVDVNTQTLNFQLSYGFELPALPDLTATLDIPYRAVQISGSGHPARMDNMFITMDGADQGIGDMSLTLKKKWLDQGNFGVNVATFLGVIFPTGDDEGEFNRAQKFTVDGEDKPAPPLNVFGRNPTDRLFPPGVQPGQGAWGVRVGGAVTRQLERGALHAGVIADLFLENDGITVGNEVKYGFSYVFPPFKSDVLAIDLSFFGRYKADSEFEGVGILGPRENFKYGNVLFFSPSLIYTPSPQFRFFVSPEIRVLEPDEGPSPAFSLLTGITVTF